VKTEPSPVINVERIQLARGSFTFTDQAVTPVTTLEVKDIAATVGDVAWPAAGRSSLELAMKLPGGGALGVKGTALLEPFDADVAITMRGAPVEPYGAYFPFRARFAGSFNGDSRSKVRVLNGAITAESRGDSWGESIRIVDPGAPAGAPPVLRIDRMALSGIDFAWPTRAHVDRVTVTKPDLRAERASDGTLALQTLFTRAEGPASTGGTPPPTLPGPPPGPAPAGGRAPAGGPAPAGLAPLPLAVSVGAIVIEDGFARFIDRTVEPAFSETVSALRVLVENFSSTPGEAAKLTVDARVGGGTLGVRGQVAAFGTPSADVSVDLREFGLSGTTPYVTNLVSWLIQRGTLTANLHYRVDGSRLAAKNAVTIANLQVSRAPVAEDKGARRLGLPLGLIVALVKDSQNRIVANVPIEGTLGDPKFDWSETIWTAVKNVLVNVAAAPFRAIGRLFTGSDNRIESAAVEPVKFAPGTVELSPDMERHVIQVADFLRRTPNVKLSLGTVTTLEDARRVKVEALEERLRTVQRERGLPDRAAAVAAELRSRLPEGAPMPPPEEQMAKLFELEPAATERVVELAARRLTAVRESLMKAEGIVSDRLVVRESPAERDGADGGHVEFEIAY
jgi:hypothetical protein